jgi:hypothetical protein
MSLAESKGPEKWVRVGPKNDIGLQHQHQHSSLIFFSHLQSSVYIFIYMFFFYLVVHPSKWVSSPQLNQQGVHISILYYIILYHIKLYYTKLYYIILYFIILLYIIVYYVIILYYIILHYIILYYIVLYYITFIFYYIVYYIMLYYIILLYIYNYNIYIHYTYTIQYNCKSHHDANRGARFEAPGRPCQSLGRGISRALARKMVKTNIANWKITIFQNGKSTTNKWAMASIAML